MVRNLAPTTSVCLFVGSTPSVISLLSPLLSEQTSSSPHSASNTRVWQLPLHGVDAIVPCMGSHTTHCYHRPLHTNAFLILLGYHLLALGHQHPLFNMDIYFSSVLSIGFRIKLFKQEGRKAIRKILSSYTCMYMYTYIYLLCIPKLQWLQLMPYLLLYQGLFLFPKTYKQCNTDKCRKKKFFLYPLRFCIQEPTIKLTKDR